MLSKVEAYVSEWNMIQKEDKVIVGVSGGADSVCLLFVLLELQKKLPFEIAVVHVNHGIRGAQADADEAYVKELCDRFGVLCYSYRKDIKTMAKALKISEEEAGREARRNCFEHAMKTYGGTKIALAHHKDDNVETFFLNLARGTGIKGLGGIRPVAGVLIRPLLCVYRQEIEFFLQEHHITYCIDSTNAEDAYTRNRIRNHVIPYLKTEVNVGVVSHVDKTMEQLQAMEEYLSEQMNFHLQTCVKETENGYILEAEAYQKVPKALQSRLLKEVLARVTVQEKDLTTVHVDGLCDLMEKQVGRRLDLPYGVEAKRVYEGLRFRKKPIGEINRKTHGRQKVTYRIIENDGTLVCDTQKNNTKWFDYDIISQEICIRTRCAGDYITIHPDGRKQKLKSYFINEKIPEEERDEILLVADGSHILWIVGYRDNPIYRVSENTKQILEVQIDKGEEKDGRDN